MYIIAVFEWTTQNNDKHTVQAIHIRIINKPIGNI